MVVTVLKNLTNLKKNIKNYIYTPTIRFMPCNLQGARIELLYIKIFFRSNNIEEKNGFKSHHKYLYI